jgi:hypothetical protein
LTHHSLKAPGDPTLEPYKVKTRFQAFAFQQMQRVPLQRGALSATLGDKTYRLVPEESRPGKKMPFMMHRERGLHLDEREAGPLVQLLQLLS